ncbi:MAG: hypothetical protein IJY61_03855 [Candidatus Gastranaerophilales bacterium]|nr:hypothetical protein [Candidatus Gastranaerophilales bacterium]
MKKFKRIIVFTFVVLSIFLCVGCNNNNNSNNNNDNTPPPYTPPPVVQEKDDVDGFKIKFGQSTLRRDPKLFTQPCYYEFYLEVTNVLDSSNYIYSNNFKIYLVANNKIHSTLNVGYNIDSSGKTIKEFTSKQKSLIKITTDRFNDATHDVLLENTLYIYYKNFKITSITFNN